jgi:2,4-dienoyl-CoA reductase (NADPH2)
VTSPYPWLATPVSLGPMRLRNRVVLNPHGLLFAGRADMLPTQRHLEYYRARAAGGAALICLESAVTSLDGRSGPLVLASQPEAVPGYRAIADAVHAHGARVCGQLTHYGNQANPGVTRAPLLAPSAVPDPLARNPAKAMTEADLDRVRDDFAVGARTFAAAGFDAVELKLAHDGLLRQFMSPLTNRRTDRYGGGTQNRLRYPLEVLAAVRDAIGRDRALSVRLVADECFPGGYDLAEGQRFARLLAESGLADYINSDIGINAAMSATIPPMGVAEGYSEPAFRALTEASGLPVVASVQIGTPGYAEQVIAAGYAAAIGMARQLIADPDWMGKALAGQAGRIRPCTRCNQLCVGNSIKQLPVSCTVNPRVGYGEVRAAQPGARPARPLQVVVVGGGVAGLEAARSAAADGHSVQLFEAAGQLGGQLRAAARLAGRTGWTDYLSWLVSELGLLGVAVRTGTPATRDLVLSYQPDAVILATGSRPAPLPGGFGPAGQFVAVDEFAARPAAAMDSSRRPERVAVLDLGAAGPALWTAGVEAAQRGAQTLIVTPLAAPASDLDLPTASRLRRRLAELGVEIRTDHRPLRAGPDEITVQHTYTGADVRLGYDLAVVVAPRVSAGDRLRDALTPDVAVQVIGDARNPRDASAAVQEGQEAAGLISAAATAGATSGGDR